MDLELNEQRRIIIDPTQLKVVRELTKGESHEMSVKTDKSLVERKLRFTHK